MQIVIEIPEEMYKHTQEYEIGGFNIENDAILFAAIKNGTPLPKGHGRIVDIDNAVKDLKSFCESFCTFYASGISAKTVDYTGEVLIEADKEVNE